jgi:DDE superfamily endonuclease
VFRSSLAIHPIADNCVTHKHPKVKARLARHTGFHINYTPTYASWFNQVERWFTLTTDQSVSRESFRSVRDLAHKLDSSVTYYNTSKRLFGWTATAHSILGMIDAFVKVLIEQHTNRHNLDRMK